MDTGSAATPIHARLPSTPQSVGPLLGELELELAARNRQMMLTVAPLASHFGNVTAQQEPLGQVRLLRSWGLAGGGSWQVTRTAAEPLTGGCTRSDSGRGQYGHHAI
jgi:hypothetical protein